MWCCSSIFYRGASEQSNLLTLSLSPQCGGNEVRKKLRPELPPAPAFASVAVCFRLQHLELSTRLIVQHKSLRSCGVFSATLCVILQEACSCQQPPPQSTDHYGRNGRKHGLKINQNHGRERGG